MKVYVITRGEYSDYGICGVTLDKDKAEIIREFVTTKWEEGMIEEYDTDQYGDVRSGEKFYLVTRHKDNTVTVNDKDGYYYERKDDYIDGRKGEVKDSNGNMWTYVTAKDEDHAIKIALDLFAKYKYRKAMGE